MKKNSTLVGSSNLRLESELGKLSKNLKSSTHS